MKQDMIDYYNQNPRFVEKYLALNTEREELARQQKEHDTAVNKFILRRLNRLQDVARSVLAKSYGKPWWSLGRDEYTFKYEWLTHNFTIHSFTATTITIHSKVAEEKKLAKDGLFELPMTILTKSDREFAKEIRSAVHARKRRVRRSQMMLAEHDLKRTQEQISDLEKEILRLNNLVAAKQRQQEEEEQRQAKKEARRQGHQEAVAAG